MAREEAFPSSDEQPLLGSRLRHTLCGHTDEINRIVWSPDGQMLASPSKDKTIGLWDAGTGALCRMLEEGSGGVYNIAWSPDSQMLALWGADEGVRLWDISTTFNTSAGPWVLRRTSEGFTGTIMTVAWSPDGRTLAFSSLSDPSVCLWDTTTRQLRRSLQHASVSLFLAWSPDGKALASLGGSSAIDLYNPETGELRQTLQGHSDSVHSVVWSPDGQTLASASSDTTIRLWDFETGQQRSVLEGHTASVTSASFSLGGRLLVSESWDGTVRLWRCDTWETVAILDKLGSIPNSWSGLAFHPSAPVLATLSAHGAIIHLWDLDFDAILSAASPPSAHYINAKVVLVGESGVGKSGLGIRLTEKEFRPTESTHGAQFWQIPVPQHVGQVDNLPENVQVELTLWDLAGQPEYRLVHQLFLDDTDVALLLFDCSNPADPFRGVPYWAKVLKKQVPQHALKFLVSARCDVSPVTVDEHEINRKLAEYGLNRHVRTSALTGEGVDALLQQVLESISWDKLTCITTPLLFRVIREFLLERKEAGGTLISINEIQHEVRQRYIERGATQVEIDTVVGLLQARGLIYRLNPTPKLSFVLLRPELINKYASSIIQEARNHPRGIGAIPEHDVVTVSLPFTGFERLEPDEEKIILESTAELLIQHDLCFREMGLLVFPSQINITRPAPTEEHPPTEVTYEFSGGIETIYASLVVRLSYTDYFQREDQWRHAVEFSREGHRLGFAMRHLEEGTGELEIYFYPGVSEFDRVTFIRFITDHLHAKGIGIQERIRLYCPQCGKEVENRQAIEARVQAGELDIPCQYCTNLVIIPRSIEEKYRSDRSYIQVQQRLAKTVEKRTEQEVKAFKTDQRQYTTEQDHRIHILHLSDIHLGTASEARKYRTQLETDLRRELKINRLEYLVISGDVANCSTLEEYEVALELMDSLVKGFGLDSSRVVVVPGNHDLNWDLSEEAYLFVPKRKLPDSLSEGQYIAAGDVGMLLRDEELYRQRFTHFSAHFYKKVYSGTEYPLDYAEQGILHLCPEDRILFLALNSCWQIDHHYRYRAGINMDALSRALDQLQDSKYDDWLKIAVWHHPVTGPEMMNDEFLQLLAVHGFQICMHGHIHETIEGYHKYDAKRGLYIIGAGTFGAPTREQVPGIPLQYNLLTLDPESGIITVETRKKEKPDGAWKADARWGDANNPVPRYTIQLT